MNAFILEACSQLCSAQLVSIQLLLELCCQQQRGSSVQCPALLCNIATFDKL